MIKQLILISIIIINCNNLCAKSSEDFISKNSIHTNEFFIDLGFCSALGLGGVGYAYNYRYQYNKWIKTEVGVGLGFTGRQYSLMPKWIYGSLNNRFSIGIGISTSELNNNNKKNKSKIYWLNVDLLGYEHYIEDSFFFHFTIGGFTSIKKTHIDQFAYFSSSKEEDDCKPEDNCIVLIEYKYYRGLQFRIGVGITF